MASVTVRGRFVDGGKVELYPGGDFFNSAVTRGKPLASSSVKDGKATFDGLTAGEQFFVVQQVDGEFRHATVTAKDKPPGKERQSEDQIRAMLAATLPAHNEGSGVITGPRSTGNATLDNPTADQRSEAVREQSAIPALHDPTPKDQLPDPDHPKAADAGKGPRRSVTPMGEAAEFDPDEPSPPVSEESALGREERKRLEAEGQKKARKAAGTRTQEQKASSRKASAARAKARKK